jgi:hypothetical protein
VLLLLLVATSSLVKSIVHIHCIEFVFAGVVFWGSKYVPQVDGHNCWNSACCMQLMLQSQESMKQVIDCGIHTLIEAGV